LVDVFGFLKKKIFSNNCPWSGRRSWEMG